MATSTPWGQSQHCTKITTGVSFHSTAGHGGVCVSRGKAKKFLSPVARKMAIDYGNGYWFEEDCLYAIPFYENEEWRNVCNEKLGLKTPMTKEKLEEGIRRYHHEYFNEDFKNKVNNIPDFDDIEVGDTIITEANHSKVIDGKVENVIDYSEWKVCGFRKSYIIVEHKNMPYRINRKYYNECVCEVKKKEN